MRRSILLASAALIASLTPVHAQSRNAMGGGFIEFLFGGDRQPQGTGIGQPQVSLQPAPYIAPSYGEQRAPGVYVSTAPTQSPPPDSMPAISDPRYLPQQVEYRTTEPVGTLVIDTPNRFLYLVEGGGMAMRYGIGVGRPGFTWAGTHQISSKKEWPDWRPPKEMLERQPYLPTFMAGGPGNPLGARAMYLGSTLYRIHGSNEPWTIGQRVSSGCIRMRNEDVTDLYERVKVGTKVVVL